MTSKRQTPNRRREISVDQEAKIEAFSRSAETLTANVESSAGEEEPVSVPVSQKEEGVVKSPKNRSFTFKMTEETLKQLQERKVVEDRSIQWIFDNILLPALNK